VHVGPPRPRPPPHSQRRPRQSPQPPDVDTTQRSHILRQPGADPRHAPQVRAGGGANRGGCQAQSDRRPQRNGRLQGRSQVGLRELDSLCQPLPALGPVPNTQEGKIRQTA